MKHKYITRNNVCHEYKWDNYTHYFHFKGTTYKLSYAPIGRNTFCAGNLKYNHYRLLAVFRETGSHVTLDRKS